MPSQTIILRIQQTGAAQTAVQIRRIATSARQTGGELDRLRRHLIGLTGAGFGVRALIQAADGFTNLGNRTRVFATDAADAKAGLEGVIDVAFRARAPLDAVAEVFQRFSLVGRAAGKDTRELLRITETLAKSVAVSGASAQEAEGALRQLAQGYGANRLSGQEFNSVAEQLPIIARLIANEVGIATDKLRSFANEGKITREVIDRALASGAGVIDDLFARTQVTFGQAFTNLQTALTTLIGKFNEASGSGNLFTSTLQGISRAILNLANDSDKLNAILKAIEIAFAGLAIRGGVAAAGMLVTFVTRVATLSRIVSLTVRGLGAFRGILLLLGGPLAALGKMLFVAATAAFAFRNTVFEIGGTKTTIRDLAVEIGSRLVGALNSAIDWVGDFFSLLVKGAGGPRKALKALIDMVYILIRSFGLGLEAIGRFVVGGGSALSKFTRSVLAGDFANAGARASEAFTDHFDTDALKQKFMDIVADGADPMLQWGKDVLGSSDFLAAAGERTKNRLAEEERLRKLREEFNNPLTSPTGEGPETIDKKKAKEIQQLRDAIRSLRGELDPAAELLNTYEDRLNDLSKALQLGIITQQQYNDLLAKVSAEFNREAADLPIEPEYIRDARDALNELRAELDPGVEALQEYSDRVKTINTALKVGAITAQEAVPILQEVTAAYTDALEELNAQSATGLQALGEGFKLSLKDLSESLGTETEIIAQGFTDAFGVAGDALKEFVETGKVDIRQLAREIIASASAAIGKLLLLRAIQGIGSALGGQSGFLGELGTPKAVGGPVGPGRTFLVGERGPELFTPPQTGRVVPSDQLGSGAAPVVNVYNVDDPESVPKAMSTKAGEQAVLNIIQRNASRLREILV